MKWTLKNIWLILALLVAVLAGRMLLTNKHFYVHDDIQIYRVNEYINCFKNGQIPCRWSDGLGKGYGLPWFNYYPPMIYAVPALIHLSGVSIITSLNLFMFATFILAAWGMYLLVKELTKREDLAFLGSVLFTLYPFHATNVFLRGVYAENLAWSITPLILFFIYRQIRSHKFINIIPFLFAFVFLTHVISSFLVVGIAFAWVIIVGINNPTNLVKNIKYLLIQIIIGVGISAFFLIPAILEKGLVQSDSLIVGYYSFINHFVSLKQLFVNYTWNYGASYWAEPSVEMGYMVGHIHLALLGITGLFAFIFHPKSKSSKDNFDFRLAISLLMSAAFILFLTHQKSLFIWHLLAPLAYIQFPWRFVGWAGIPLVMSIPMLILSIPKKLSYLITSIAVISLLFYSYPFFTPREYDSYVDADFLTGVFKYEQESKALFDYLPITVKQVPELYADESDYPIPVFYFPGWSATIGGKSVEIAGDPITGLIIPSTPTSGIIDLSWGETPFRLSMDILSILTLIAYGFYIYKSHVQ